MSLGYSDAPVPSTGTAQFAVWKNYIDEQLARILRSKISRYTITVTGTSDASGFITFDHGSLTTPSAVFCQVTEPTLPTSTWCNYVDNLDITTARARFLESSAGSIVSHGNASTTFFAYVVV